MLPQIAQGDANKLWIVPSEMGKALEGIGSFFGNSSGDRKTQLADETAPPELPGPDGTGSVTRLPGV
jgi:hypothetical protein